MSKSNVFTKIETYLTKNYEIRKNTIALQFECRKKPTKQWLILNENNLYIELSKNEIKCSINQLICVLKSDYIKEYNPIKDYLLLNYEKHNKQEYRAVFELVKLVETKEPAIFFKHLQKWLVRCVKCAMEDNYFNKQALIFIGGQNCGKTSLLRWLCPYPLQHYYSENFAHDKDNRIMLAKNFIINIDELAALSKYDINALKSYFSKTIINERLPYENKNSILYRCANFVGSTNQSTFLADETGSVRWLCFELVKINYMYSKKVNVNEIWAEAYHLYLDKKFNCEITAEEIKEIQEQNKDYQIRTIEIELIEKYFKVPDKDDLGMFFTSTEIMEEINRLCHNKTKINSIAIGKALIFLGYQRVKQGSKYGYFSVPLYNQIESKTFEPVKSTSQNQKLN